MLRREVRLRHPIGSAGAQRLSLFKRLVYASLLFSPVVGFVVGPRTMRMYGCSRKDDAQLDVKRYVDEAYSLWRRQNPARTCPRELVELNELTHKGKRIIDPWRTPYAFTCNHSGLRVSSAGEDAIFGTGDDVNSWE